METIPEDFKAAFNAAKSAKPKTSGQKFQESWEKQEKDREEFGRVFDEMKAKAAHARIPELAEKLQKDPANSELRNQYKTAVEQYYKGTGVWQRVKDTVGLNSPKEFAESVDKAGFAIGNLVNTAIDKLAGFGEGMVTSPVASAQTAIRGVISAPVSLGSFGLQAASGLKQQIQAGLGDVEGAAQTASERLSDAAMVQNALESFKGAPVLGLGGSGLMQRPATKEEKDVADVSQFATEMLLPVKAKAVRLGDATKTGITAEEAASAAEKALRAAKSSQAAPSKLSTFADIATDQIPGVNLGKRVYRLLAKPPEVPRYEIPKAISTTEDILVNESRLGEKASSLNREIESLLDPVTKVPLPENEAKYRKLVDEVGRLKDDLNKLNEAKRVAETAVEAASAPQSTTRKILSEVGRTGKSSMAGAGALGTYSALTSPPGEPIDEAVVTGMLLGPAIDVAARGARLSASAFEANRPRPTTPPEAPPPASKPVTPAAPAPTPAPAPAAQAPTAPTAATTAPAREVQPQAPATQAQAPATTGAVQASAATEAAAPAAQAPAAAKAPLAAQPPPETAPAAAATAPAAKPPASGIDLSTHRNEGSNVPMLKRLRTKGHTNIRIVGTTYKGLKKMNADTQEAADLVLKGPKSPFLNREEIPVHASSDIEWVGHGEGFTVVSFREPSSEGYKYYVYKSTPEEANNIINSSNPYKTLQNGIRKNNESGAIGIRHGNELADAAKAYKLPPKADPAPAATAPATETTAPQETQPLAAAQPPPAETPALSKVAPPTAEIPTDPKALLDLADKLGVKVTPSQKYMIEKGSGTMKDAATKDIQSQIRNAMK